MLIADIMALIVPPVTDLLRRAQSADGTLQPQPMFPTIIAIRNDRVVAAVSSPRMAATLSCAQTLAVGLDTQALVLAAEAGISGSRALAYSVMTRERQAKFVLQQVHGEGADLQFGEPIDGGEPPDPTIFTALAQAVGQPPMDITTVLRKDKGGTFGDRAFLTPEHGRVVVDAGTITTLQQRVDQIGGQALYVARSPEAAKLALEAGLPRRCLLGG